jgi:hypothetical protein
VNSLQEKVCRRCKNLSPLDTFSNKKSNKDGKDSLCPDCKSIENRLSYENNREERLDYQRQYRLDHPEECRAANKKWYAAHAEENHMECAQYREDHHEELKVKKAIWYQENKKELQSKAAIRRQGKREELRLQAKKYRLENPETVRIAKAKYNKTHPEIKKAARQRRHALKMQAPINNLSVAQWEEILIAFDYRCAYCPPRCKACKNKTHVLEQEHVTSYVNHGSHTLWNVVPACRSHNAQKHTGPPLLPVQPLLLTIALPRKIKKKVS